MASYFVHLLQPQAYVYLLHFYGHLLCNDISEHDKIIYTHVVTLTLVCDGPPECYTTTSSTWTHTHAYVRTHAHLRPTDRQMQTPTHTRARTFMHTHGHSCTHTDTHAHTTHSQADWTHAE